MATGHGRGGSNGRGKAKSAAEAQRLAPPQWRCAPHPLLTGGGEFSCNLPVLRWKLVRIVQERLLGEKPYGSLIYPKMILKTV